MINSVEDFVERAKPELVQIYAYALNASLYEEGPREEFDDDAYMSEFNFRFGAYPSG